MEMAVKTMKGTTRSAGRRRWRGEHLPRRRHHEGALPLSLISSWLLGSPHPWRWDPWGGKNMALEAGNSWVEEVLTLGFLSAHLGVQ